MKDDQLQSILFIARNASLRGRGHSLRDLLDATRYRELRPYLSEKQVAASLKTNPEIVADWLRYSQDKRTSGGWYLSEQPPHWTISRLDSRVAEWFASAEEACAAFVLRELDFWASVP